MTNARCNRGSEPATRPGLVQRGAWMARTIPLLTMVLTLGAAFAFADEAGDAKAVASAWNRIKRLNAAAAAAMPEAAYSFKPSPDVRSFGQIIGHLANEHYTLCSEVK